MKAKKCLTLLLASCTVAVASATVLPEYDNRPEKDIVTNCRFGGEVGKRIDAVVNNWVLTAWDANPMMTEMLRLRDRKPPYEMPVPWAGEFVGKHLTAAVALSRLCDDPRLEVMTAALVDELADCQDPNGYLGPFAKADQLMGNWDLWGHNHILYGLIGYYRRTGSEKALRMARRIGDLVCDTYLDSGRKLHEAKSYEMNMAIGHGMALLYGATGEKRYLDMALETLREWETEGAGDYYRQGLAGTPFYLTPKPRWESLHCIPMLAELYRITGDESYKRSLLNLWRSILASDIHNNGSFTAGEGAVGNPFRPGAIETCCTVSWIALSVDALRLTHDPAVADALELALWNAVLAYIHPSGRWVAYDTPMDGKREASAHTIVFQSRAGTPELNCCSVNGPRGLGMLADWAVLPNEPGETDALYINHYGPGEMTVSDRKGRLWTVTNETDYPVSGQVTVRIDPQQAAQTVIHLRIPAWSAHTTATLVADGKRTPLQAVAGRYLPIDRVWKKGDKIELSLDMSPHYLRGDQYVQGRSSVYHGPVLLAWDQSRNETDADRIPTLQASTLRLKPVPQADYRPADRRFPPIVLYEVSGTDAEGKPATIRLCDFASAGATGAAYRSWLPVEGTGPMATPPVPFKEGDKPAFVRSE